MEIKLTSTNIIIAVSVILALVFVIQSWDFVFDRKAEIQQFCKDNGYEFAESLYCEQTTCFINCCNSNNECETLIS